MDGWMDRDLILCSELPALCSLLLRCSRRRRRRASDGEESVDHLRCGWHTHAKYGAEK